MQLLFATRECLVKQKVGLKNAVKEYRNIGLLQNDPVLQSQQRLIKSYEKEIANLEVQIDDIVSRAFYIFLYSRFTVVFCIHSFIMLTSGVGCFAQLK